MNSRKESAVETFRVVYGPQKDSYTKEELQAWTDTYILKNKGVVGELAYALDLHQMFADKVGLPRQEAKVLCYKIMNEHPFLSPIMKEAQILEEVRGIVRD